MTKRKRHNKGGRQPAEPLTYIKTGHAIATLVTESERGCVLSVATLLDDELEMLLRAKFEAGSGLSINSPNEGGKLVRELLFQGKMPVLGTFAVRISICRVLGLISAETEQALNDLRDMRNDAAHIYRIFKVDESIVDSLASALSEKQREELDRRAAMMENFPKWRARFIHAAVLLANQLEEDANRMATTKKQSS